MRSWLFAPANHQRRSEKAFELGADVVVLDLEDACPEAEKDGARVMATAALARPRQGLGYVRINGLSTGRAEADLRAVAGRDLDGIVLPKAERPEDLEFTDRILSALERERGLADGAIDLVPLIETARGVADIRAVARGPARMRRFAFGSVDFALDLRARPGPDERELDPYRASLVLAARVEGLEPPIDSACLAVNAPALFEATALRARAMGFQGKLCIHPSQVPLANAVFTPSAREVETAARIVEAFEAAERSGSAAITVGGELVDFPVYRRALATLAQAGG